MAKLILPDSRTFVLLPGDAGQTLMALLMRAGVVFDAPCGGNGRCGKCAARVTGGSLTRADADEQKQLERLGTGYRLLCRARVADIESDILLDTLPALPARSAVPTVSSDVPEKQIPSAGTASALAIDLGTTTLELSLIDPAHPEKPLCRTRVPNPQRTFGADVMSRLSAARSGKAEELRALVQNELLKEAFLLCKTAGYQSLPETFALCGNPAMLCLALGIEPKGLLRAPFTLPETFGKSFPADALLPGCKGTLFVPPVTGPFTGADLTCALIASGFDRLSAPALFCDLGTNAELCLFDCKRFTCCSAAAGPAFEGAGICMGGCWGPGAITRCGIENGSLSVETFNNTPADHLSANGLFDAAAALYRLGRIDPSGAVVSATERENGIRLGDTDVYLYKEDIRALQTAKAAVCAALGLLLRRSGIKGPIPLYVTGGIAVSDAFRTLGIIPDECIPVRAESALSGLELFLSDPGAVTARMHSLAARCTVLPLAGDPAFEEAFLAAMAFRN